MIHEAAVLEYFKPFAAFKSAALCSEIKPHPHDRFKSEGSVVLTLRVTMEFHGVKFSHTATRYLSSDKEVGIADIHLMCKECEIIIGGAAIKTISLAKRSN